MTMTANNPSFEPAVTRAKRGTIRSKDHVFDGIANEFSLDPDLYTRMYDRLPPISEDNPASLFSNARQHPNTPVAPLSPRQILPGAWSFDHTVLKFQRELTTEQNDHLKPELDEDGFTLNGLHSTFDSIRSVSGYPQLPVSALPRNNRQANIDLGLQDKMTRKQRSLAEKFCHLMMSELDLTAIHIPKMSNCGAPRNVNDSELKMNYALNLFSGDKFNSLLKTYASHDAHALHRDFEFVMAMGTNVRWQVDKPGKKRDAWFLDDVRKEDSPHKRPITTSVVIDGVEYLDFAAMRTRLVNTGPWNVNVVGQIFATGFLYSMFRRFPHTFHFPEADIEAFLEGKHTYFADVSTYDQSFSEEKLDLFFDVMRCYVSSDIVDIVQDLVYSAYFTRPLQPSDRPTFLGNPFRYWERQIIAGNRSGHSFTAMLAKLFKVIDTFCKFERMGYDVEEHLEDYLNAKKSCGCINNGDDEIVWFGSERDKRVFVKVSDSMTTSDRMFKVTMEVGAVFSGKVYQRVGPTSYRAAEKITTPFERILCPERSIGGNFRKFWPIGILERYNKRGNHPMLEEAWRIFDSTYHRIMEPEYGSFLGLIQRAYQDVPLSLHDLSFKDLEVLEEPSKLHYKYSQHEISAGVQDHAFVRLQPSFFESIIREHYCGTIH